MRRHLTAAVLAGLVASTAGAADVAPPPRPILDVRAGELDGEYAVTAIGQLPRRRPQQTAKIVIAGKGWTTFTTHTPSGSVSESTMTVTLRPDVAGGATAVDLMPGEGGGDDGPWPGIYKVEGGVITLAYYRPTGFAPVDRKTFVRPTDFEARGGVFIVELKRVEKKK